ncbi:MAG: DUF3341 domain-containing protein [Lautropia sp.]
MIVLAFDRIDPWRDAIGQLVAQGVRGIDAHSPAAVDGVAEVLEARASPVRPAMLVGALVGALGTLALQYWHSVVAYPLNLGGRPHDAWPAFGFPVFEVAILGAALAGFVALLLACRLPAPHHAFFASVSTEAASDDRFFISIPSDQSSALALATLAKLPGVVSFFEVPTTTHER